MPTLLMDPEDSYLWDVTFGCLQALYSGIPLLSPSPSITSTLSSPPQAPPMSSGRAGGRSNTLTGGSVDVIRREQVCDVFSSLITRTSILLAREEEMDDGVAGGSNDTQSICQASPVNPILQVRLVKTLRDWVVHAKDQVGGDAIGQRVGVEGLRTLLERMGQGLTEGWDGVLGLIGCVLEEWEGGQADPGQRGKMGMDEEGHSGKDKSSGEMMSEEGESTLQSHSTPSLGHLSPAQPPGLKLSPSGMSTMSHTSAVEGGSLMRETFACIQLICTDFLGSLSQPMLQECVRIVGRFGRQTEGLNVSLTAIQLLWMISDQLRGMLMQDEDDQARSQAQPVWLLLLRELARLGEDDRREVRHSACQSLFRLVEGMGTDRLNGQAWREGIAEVLLPLAELLNSRSSILPGHGGKKGLKKAVFQEPEWVETRQVVVSGMVRVMGSSGPEQITFLDEEWKGLMHLLTQCIQGDPEASEEANGTRDRGGVEDAAIQGLSTLVSLCGEGEELPGTTERMESIWRVWLNAVEGMLHGPGAERVRRGRFLTAVVGLIPSLCPATQVPLDASRVQEIMRLLGRLAQAPLKEWSMDRERLGPVQEGVVKAVDALLTKVEEKRDGVRGEDDQVQAVEAMMREVVHWVDYPILRPPGETKDASAPGMTWIAFGIWSMKWIGYTWTRYLGQPRMYLSNSEKHQSVYVALLQVSRDS